MTHVHSGHLAGLTAVHSSGGGVAAAVVVAYCLLAFAVSVMLVVGRAGQDHTDGRDGDPGPEGGGGGGGGGPDDPRPSLDDPRPFLDEPVWWPEFERQFADHVTSTIRT